MRRFNLDIWANYTKNLIGLVAIGGVFASFWGDSACSISQKRAMFSMA